MSPTHAPRSSARGGAALGAMFLALAAGGLSYGLLMTGLAERKGLDRADDAFRALEVAERGLVASEVELASGVDAGEDGLGVVAGSWTNGAYTVTATNDAAITDRWALVATGTHRTGHRRLEVGIRRIQGGMFIEGLFSRENLVFNGVNKTDAFDSRLGTYAAQAVNTDAGGTYALPGGNVGSNSGFIELNGSSIYIRGNAIPGPGRAVNESGDPTVTGDTTARKQERNLEPTPLAEFQSANTTNANGTWTAVGGNVQWNATSKALSLKAGAVVTFAPGTYFFTSFTMAGNSTIKFTGPTKIYVTGSLDWTGGTLVNTTGKPADLQVFGHPYAVPSGFTPTSTNVKINGGSGAAFALYAPEGNLTLGGGSHVYGAAVAKTININGNCWFHYDKALDDVGRDGTARIQRLYWRDLAPPRR